MPKKPPRIETKLTHLGLSPKENFGIPNPPIYRTSTILSESLAQHRGEIPKKYTYGRVGTPTSDAFESSIAALYGAESCISAPSGLSAISTAILSVAKAGDHMLFPDSLYGSARRFVVTMLPKMGVDIAFYPPRIDADISTFFKSNTSLLYLESPGSLTFEIQDVPAMTAAARTKNITTMIDNTWGTALHYPVLALGADIVVEAATKYIGGHSDTNLGIAAANGKHGSELRRTAIALGTCAGPEDLYLGLRGLRTMKLRLSQSAENGLAVATAAESHGAAISVLHPGLPSSRDHAIFTRDFTGPCGLFGIVVKPEITQASIDAAIEAMSVFYIGDSWGGYESLIKQAHLTEKLRSLRPDLPEGHIIRIYTGLEHCDDQIADVMTMLDGLSEG